MEPEKVIETLVETNEQPSDILQSKIDELVKTISDLQKEKAKSAVEITNLKIELNAANHLLDAKTKASDTNNNDELVDEEEIGKLLMEGNY